MSEEKVKDNKTISLKDIITLVDDFINGKITAKEMADYGAKMTVKSYLSVVDKMAVATVVSTKFLYSTNEMNEVKVAEAYKDMFFYGVLEGYGMVDCSDRSLQTFENYDKLCPIFQPFILSFCESDYSILKGIVKDSILSYGFNGFIEAVTGIDGQVLKEATRENQNMLKSLGENKDLIKDLKELAAINNPMAQKVVDELREIALKKANEETTKKLSTTDSE